MTRPFHVIAHRGVSAEAPENTLPAFERALAIGVVEVELDAQLSRDGVPVLFHDGTLDAKTPLRGPRARARARRSCWTPTSASWFDRTHPGEGRRWAGTRLTTLRAVFDAFGARLRYHVELKDDLEATPARVIELIAASGLESRVMLTSFSRAQLERARRSRAGDSGSAGCSSPRAPERIDEAADAGFAMVGVDAGELTEPLVRRRTRADSRSAPTASRPTPRSSTPSRPAATA